MLKMTIDNEEVLSDNDISIKEEILSPSSTILNNVYPKSWELDKDYTSRFYYPKDYSKLNIQNFNIEPEEAGKTIQINGSATLTDVDTSKESRVLRILGQTSQTGTPTPSSPIPINVVSGDNEINICGKNLLNLNGFVKGRLNNSTGQIEYANNVSSLVVSGNDISFTASVSWNNGITSDFIPIQQGKYFYRGTPIGDKLYVYVDYYDKDKNWISRLGSANSNDGVEKVWELNFNEPNAKYIRLHYEKATTGTMTISNSMLEKSNTATTYEPYIGNTYPIYLGVENLAQITATGSYNCTLSDGVFTSISYSGYGNIRPAITQITLPANKTIYYSADIRLKNGTSSGALNNMAIFGTTNTYTTNKLVNPTISSEFQRYIFSITPTIDEPAKGLLIQTNSGSSNAVIEIKNIMISYSYSNDFYEYGVTPIELCKIGTYQDYIYKDNGSWYLHKEIGKDKLSSSNVVYHGVYNYKYQFEFTLSQTSIAKQKIYSTHFYNNSTIQWWTIDNNIYLNGASVAYITSTQYTSITAFNNFTSTNDVYVYYPLATPIDIPIEDTTLIEQLEALSS